MSKERLEEIREIDQEISNGFALEDLYLNTMTVVNRDHFEWLIEQAERVQKLEEEVDRYHISLWQELVLNHVLTEQNKRYREAREIIEQVYKESYVRNAYGYEDGFLDGLDTAINSIDE